MNKAVNIASYICNEYQKMSGEAIDEMKLHKLLYFSQRESIALTGEPLFSDEFEGWRYGPVCVAVRETFYKGEMLIPTQPLTESEAYITQNIILQYGELASWKLSQISHSEISWKNSRKGLNPSDNGKKPLLLDDIKKDAEKVRVYDSIWDMYVDEFDDYEDNIW